MYVDNVQLIKYSLHFQASQFVILTLMSTRINHTPTAYMTILWQSLTSDDMFVWRGGERKFSCQPCYHDFFLSK